MRRTTAGLMALLAVLLLSPAAFACRGHSERSHVRACFANQKTIAGALEMYDLDNNLSPEPRRTRRLTRQALQPLVDGGYLQSFPSDPGQGSDAYENYVQLPASYGIACLVHGTIEESGRRPAREQLAALGVTDVSILDAALATLPPPPRAPFPVWILSLAVVFAALQELLGRMMRWLHGGERSFSALLTAGRSLAVFTWLLATVPAWRFTAELPLAMQGFLLLWITMPVSALMVLWSLVRRFLVPIEVAPVKWPIVRPISRPRRQAMLPPALPVPGVKLLTLVPGADAKCPICGDKIGRAAAHCQDCRTPHHRDCFIYNGCCGMYGCGGSSDGGGVS